MDPEQLEQPGLRRVWRVTWWREGSSEPRNTEFGTLEAAESEAWRVRSFLPSKSEGRVAAVIVQTRLVSAWENVTRVPVAMANADATVDD